MGIKGFKPEQLPPEVVDNFKGLGRLARGDILKMTTLAGSGHPGGSMSSIDIYLVLYSCANLSPDALDRFDRDRIIISHGHTSPGVYAALGRLGFFDIDQAISQFRRRGTIFEGHVERGVPGVEWSTGNLGQGLSAACGFALAGKLHHLDFQVFVAMSDGEQTKGQVSEARRFAKKYSLNNITVIIDYNKRQISGSIHDVMPQNTKELYLADGWQVLEIDGHDYQQIYQALRQAVNTKDCPVAIIAHTKMGKGVSFMEDNEEFHGKPLSLEQYRLALSELGLEDDLDRYQKLREGAFPPLKKGRLEPFEVKIEVGTPHTYGADKLIDNRSAFGRVMKELGELNCGRKDRTPIAVFDCDLANSVRTTDFAKICPHNFFQGGVQEHNTATIAGALSTQRVLTFFADFGVFGVDETFNQHRLNDINHTNLKLVCTHCGLDVGEDGKTHQCIDYAGMMRNLYSFKIIVPADPNQTDRVIRYIATQPGNFLVTMGRSKLPVILREDGKPFFGEDYQFRYGKADIVRQGEDGAIISMGSMLHRAVQAHDILKQQGYRVRVINLPCLSDVDVAVIKEAAETGLIITYEDHNIRTGLGSILADVIAEEGLSTRFRRLGITDYGGSGKPDELFKAQNLDVESLVNIILEEIDQ